jgi:hypothetical protein
VTLPTLEVSNMEMIEQAIDKEGREASRGVVTRARAAGDRCRWGKDLVEARL